MTAGRDTLSARIRDTSLEVVRRQPVAAEVPAVVDCSAQRPHSTDVAGYAEGAEVFRLSVTLGAEPVVVPLDVYKRQPRYGFALVVGFAAALGLPGLIGFWGEVLSVYSAWTAAASRPSGLFQVCAVVAAIGMARCV